MCNVACITQYMGMALLRTAFRTIIQSSKATKWVRKQTLLVNLWHSSKKDRTDQSAYQVFDSQQSRCRCRCRWVLSIFLVKIKLPSLIFTAMEKLGREKQLYQGGKQQSKERRGPFPSILVLHGNQTWAVVYIPTLFHLVHPNLQPEYCMPSKLSIYIQYKIYNNNNNNK